MAAGRVPVAVCLSIWLLVLPCSTQAERPPRQIRAMVPGEDPNGARVVVKFKAQGTLMRAMSARPEGLRGPQHAATLAKRNGLQLTDGHAISERIQVVHGDKRLSSAALAERLSADPEVEYAVPDLRRHALGIPSDALFAASDSISPVVGQWYLRAPDSTIVSAINAVGAWAITTGKTGIVVADLDSGVRFDHPDLTAKLLPGRNFVSTGNVTGAGWSDDATDPGDGTEDGQCGAGVAGTPSSWHGTQTAGLIGAQTNNGLGMASVGYNVMVLPVRVLGPCGGYDSDIVAAMLWAANLGLPSGDPAVPENKYPARVINLSLGSTGRCDSKSGLLYRDAVQQLAIARVVVVAAAGNAEGLAVLLPGNCAGVIAVAGVRQVGTKVGYSSLGPEVAISAPAGNCVNSDTPAKSGIYPAFQPCLYPILTTTNNGMKAAAANTYTTGTTTESTDLSLGTSFSSPLVSGTVALMLSVNSALAPVQIKETLQATARMFPTTGAMTVGTANCQAPSDLKQIECYCTTTTCGAGMLDAGAAVASVYAATQSPLVQFTVSPATPVVGTAVTLDGAGSTAVPGRSISSYQWTIISGGALASFTGATTGRSATLATSAVGEVVLSLTVTDNTGASRSTSQTLSITAAPVVVTPAASGGGAMGGGWLLGLAVVVGLLTRWPRRVAAG